MSEDFEKRLKAALKEAFMPFISGMVRQGFVNCKMQYEALDPNIPEQDKEAIIMKSVEKMARDIKSVTGEEG